MDRKQRIMNKSEFYYELPEENRHRIRKDKGDHLHQRLPRPTLQGKQGEGVLYRHGR